MRVQRNTRDMATLSFENQRFKYSDIVCHSDTQHQQLHIQVATLSPGMLAIQMQQYSIAAKKYFLIHNPTTVM